MNLRTATWMAVTALLAVTAIGFFRGGDTQGGPAIVVGQDEDSLSGGHLYVGSEFIHLGGDFENSGERPVEITAVSFVRSKGIGTVIDVPRIQIAPRWGKYQTVYPNDPPFGDTYHFGTFHVYPMPSSGPEGKSCIVQRWAAVEGFFLPPGEDASIATLIHPVGEGRFVLHWIRIDYRVGDSNYSAVIKHTRKGTVTSAPRHPPSIEREEEECMKSDPSIEILPGWGLAN